MFAEFLMLGVKFLEVEQALDFFLDAWNFIPITQLVFYYFKFGLVFSSYGCPKTVGLSVLSTNQLLKQDWDTTSVLFISVDLVLIILGFMRIFYFLRLWPTFGMLIQMVNKTIIELRQFLIFNFLWIALFAILNLHLKVEIDGEEDSYPHLPRFPKFFFKTFRDSIGDITVPGYKNWYKYRSDENLGWTNFGISLIWLVFMANQIFNNIVLLNFLIALISQIYEEAQNHRVGIEY